MTLIKFKDHQDFKKVFIFKYYLELHFKKVTFQLWISTIQQSEEINKDVIYISNLLQAFRFHKHLSRVWINEIHTHIFVRKCMWHLEVLWTNFIHMFHLQWCLHSMRYVVIINDIAITIFNDLTIVNDIAELLWYST